MKIPNTHYLIIDVEATCSNDGSVPREEMEIIEIGAVMQRCDTFEIESEFQGFIRPVRHPELTAFCTELTNITDEHLTDAPSFADAIGSMKQWMGNYEDYLFCSWGDYDRGQFIQDCEYHGIEYLFGAGHLNLKTEFSKSVGQKKRFGVSAALRYAGLKFVGSHHRGLDDAKNIARIVRWVGMGGQSR